MSRVLYNIFDDLSSVTETGVVVIIECTRSVKSVRLCTGELAFRCTKVFQDIDAKGLRNSKWHKHVKALLGCASLEPLTSKQVKISTNTPKLTPVRPREDPQAMPFQKVKQWSTQDNNEIEWNIGIVGGFDKPTMACNVFYNCYCY